MPAAGSKRKDGGFLEPITRYRCQRIRKQQPPSSLKLELVKGKGKGRAVDRDVEQQESEEESDVGLLDEEARLEIRRRKQPWRQDDGWTTLPRWELSESPMRLRRQAFEHSIRLFQENLSKQLLSLYRPLLRDLKVMTDTIAASNQSNSSGAYIPVSFRHGASSLMGDGGRGGDNGSSGLHAILLSGQSPHPTFFQSLRKTVFDEEVNNDDAKPSSLRLYVELLPGECQVLATSLKMLFARLAPQLIIRIIKETALKPEQDQMELLEVAQQLETAASAGDPFAFSQLLRMIVDETRSSSTEWDIEQILCIVVMPDASKADQQCMADALTVLLRILQPDPVDEIIAQQMLGTSASAELDEKMPQPRGQLMLVASSASWSDWQLEFPYDVLRIMEVHPMQTPNTKHLLEELIKETLIPKLSNRADLVPPVSFDLQQLALLEQVFFESGGNVDRLLQSIRLLLLHYFTTDPFSVFCQPHHLGPLAKQGASSADWTPSFWSAARLRIGQDINAIQVQAQDPTHTDELRVFQACFTQDDGDVMCLIDDIRRVSRYHTQLRAHFILLQYKLQEELQQGNTKPMQSYSEYELYKASLDLGYDSVTEIGKMWAAAASRLKFEELLPALEAVSKEAGYIKKSPAYLEARVALQIFVGTEHYSQLVQSAEQRADKYVDLLRAAIEEGRALESSARHASLQNHDRQQRERSKVRQRLTSWFTEQLLDEMLKPAQLLFPLASVFQTDASSTASVERQMCPAPRLSLQLALEAPELCFASGLAMLNEFESEQFAVEVPRSEIGAAAADLANLKSAAVVGVLPDLSRLFDSYQEVGTSRIINLFDWYGVFRVGIVRARRVAERTNGGEGAAESDALHVGAKVNGDQGGRTLRRRKSDEQPSNNNGSSSQPNGDRGGDGLVDSGDDLFFADEAEDLAPEDERELRIRFSVALFQMAAMGLIRSTGKKPEHVAKVLFDIPVIESK